MTATRKGVTTAVPQHVSVDRKRESGALSDAFDESVHSVRCERSAALVGMAIGASGGGWLGDRFGRRPVLVISSIAFGLATAAASLTHTVSALTALRMVSGMGFGAAVPNGFALATEWLAPSMRARAVGLLTISAPLGGIIGALGSLVVLPLYGWRGCFVICGAGTLAVSIVMLIWLPESPSYLVRSGRDVAARQSLLRIIGRSEDPDLMRGPAVVVGRKTIFTRQLMRLNIGAALAFFSVAFVTYAISSWMPTILTTAGLVPADAIRGSFLFSLFAIFGALIVASLLPKRGSKAALVTTCLMSLVIIIAICGVLLSGSALQSNAWKALLLALIGCSGATTGGATAAIYSILSFGYPLERRATGIGFGLMAGRLGGIVTILSSGLLLHLGGNNPTQFSPPWRPFSSLPRERPSSSIVMSAPVIIRNNSPAR